jgi:hypothetical protein
VEKCDRGLTSRLMADLEMHPRSQVQSVTPQ